MRVERSRALAALLFAVGCGAATPAPATLVPGRRPSESVAPHAPTTDAAFTESSTEDAGRPPNQAAACLPGGRAPALRFRRSVGGGDTASSGAPPLLTEADVVGAYGLGASECEFVVRREAAGRAARWAQAALTEAGSGVLTVVWNGADHGRLDARDLGGRALRGTCDDALMARLCAEPVSRRLGTNGVEVAVPPSWALSARPNGFHFEVGDFEVPLTIYPDANEAGDFEALPRGDGVAERVLPSGLLHYRRERAGRTAVFVKLRLPDQEHGWVCSTEQAYASVCRSLRASD